MSSHRTSDRLLLGSILLLAILARVVVAVATQSWIFPTSRSFGFEMGAIASSIAAGYGFSWPGDLHEPTAWMPPAYPYVIAGVFKLFGTYTPVSAVVLETLQTAFSVGTCALLAIVGRRVVGREPALVAAALYAVYPPAIHFAVQKIWSTSLVAFSVVLLLGLFLRLRDRLSTGRSLALALAFGLAGLLDPLTLGIVPFGFGWLFLAGGRDARAVLRSLALTVAVIILATAPWIARNQAAFGSFVFIKSNLGHELYLGNNDLATGRWNDSIPEQILPGGAGGQGWSEEARARAPGMRVRRTQPSRLLTPAETAFVTEANEAERNRLYLRKATDWIRAHPLRFLGLSTVRFADFWTNVRRTHTPSMKVAAASYIGLMVLTLVGLAVGAGRRREAALVLVFALALSMPFYLTIVRHWRYRFPIETLFTLFAAFALTTLSRRVRRRGRPPPAEAAP